MNIKSNQIRNNLLNKLRKNEKQVKFRLRESFYLNVSVKIRPFSISLSKVRKKIISMLQRYFLIFKTKTKIYLKTKYSVKFSK